VTGTRYSMPWFDNVLVNRLDGKSPAPTPALPGQKPMYTAGPAAH
jgi:hypothetical protein